jgi:heme-degrading monooxygenase HmoA
MFAVLFEVYPRADQWDAYLANAKMLRPELENIDGFIENIRYKSLTRDGWILSWSQWRDEKAVVRWRTTMRHHLVQEKGRSEILRDYHLRVGQITHDTQVPKGQVLAEQRLDETEVGGAKTVVLIDAKSPGQAMAQEEQGTRAAWLELDAGTAGLVGWDAFEAVLEPGTFILMTSWRKSMDADTFKDSARMPDRARVRQVRIVRDYGMFDRREAPQYYPEVKPTESSP